MKKASPLLVAFVTVAIDLLGFGIVLPLLPVYGDKLLADYPKESHGVIIGLLMASFSAMQFLFSPAWGRLSDRIGRRPVLIISLASSAVFYLLFGVASVLNSLTLLFISRIGAGIAGATIGTAQAVIADSTPPEKRAKGMALIGMAFGVGFTVGPLIGTVLLSGEENAPLSPAPGYMAAAISFAAMLLAFFRLPETRPVGGERRATWFNLDGWRLALGNSAIAIPLLTFFVATMAFAGFEGTVARFAKDELKIEVHQLGDLFAYIGLILILAQGFIVRRLVTKVGEVKMTLAGLTMMLVGLVAIAAILTSHGGGHSPEASEISSWNAQSFFMYAAMTLTVIGFAFWTPSLQALVSRRSSIYRQGELLGVNQAASAIARILGPLLGNILYGSATGSNHALPAYGGAGLLAIALLLALKLRDSDASPKGAVEPAGPPVL